jgi:hypothetical protein
VKRALRFFQQIQVLIGLAIVGFFVLVAVFAGQIAPMEGPNIYSDEPTPYRIIGNRFDGQPRPQLPKPLWVRPPTNTIFTP